MISWRPMIHFHQCLRRRRSTGSLKDSGRLRRALPSISYITPLIRVLLMITQTASMLHSVLHKKMNMNHHMKSKLPKDLIRLKSLVMTFKLLLNRMQTLVLNKRKRRFLKDLIRLRSLMIIFKMYIKRIKHLFLRKDS